MCTSQGGIESLLCTNYLSARGSYNRHDCVHNVDGAIRLITSRNTKHLTPSPGIDSRSYARLVCAGEQSDPRTGTVCSPYLCNRLKSTSRVLHCDATTPGSSSAAFKSRLIPCTRASDKQRHKTIRKPNNYTLEKEHSPKRDSLGDLIDAIPAPLCITNYPWILLHCRHPSDAACRPLSLSGSLRLMARWTRHHLYVHTIPARRGCGAGFDSGAPDTGGSSALEGGGTSPCTECASCPRLAT